MFIITAEQSIDYAHASRPVDTDKDELPQAVEDWIQGNKTWGQVEENELGAALNNPAKAYALKEAMRTTESFWKVTSINRHGSEKSFNMSPLIRRNHVRLLLESDDPKLISQEYLARAEWGFNNSQTISWHPQNYEEQITELNAHPEKLPMVKTRDLAPESEDSAKTIKRNMADVYKGIAMRFMSADEGPGHRVARVIKEIASLSEKSIEQVLHELKEWIDLYRQGSNRENLDESIKKDFGLAWSDQEQKYVAAV